MVDPTRCGDVADALAEVATGAASGPDRARVLAHLAECPACRHELEELTRVADDVLLVAPEHDPPAGFEGGVLARIAALTPEAPAAAPAVVAAPVPPPPPPAQSEPDAVVTPLRRRRWQRALPYAAAAAVAGLVGAGVVWQATSEERDLAASYSETLDVANGRYFHAAPIVDDGGTQVGHVFLYQGEPSWVFTVLDDTVEPGGYEIVVTTEDWSEPIAECEVTRTGGGAGATVDASIYQIEQIELVGANGTTFAADLDDHSPPSP